LKIDLSGKVAIVTGGSRGIGHATAAMLYEAGARVAILARDGAKAEQAAAGFGERARGYRCDVSSGADVETAVAALERDLGATDILVNNAGVTADNLIFRMTEDAWDAVQDTNLKGAFLMTKSAARGMIKRRWGRIINITSIVGLAGNKGQTNYAASKAGLNAVAPGYVATELTRNLSGEAKQGLQAGIALGRLGECRDIAGAVLFLASDLASYITGQVLVVDGGMVM
jgi:3-oxoacyl-[acyl-carrier protein] reductase